MREHRKLAVITSVLGICAALLLYGCGTSMQTIKLDIPAPKDTAGGIIVADIDNDNRMDYLVTVPGHIAAYANDGRKLWIKKTDIHIVGKSETNGLPGHHGPGIAAGDVDGDGKCEVIYITKDSVIHIIDGKTGETETTAKPPYPKEAQRWEVVMIADFRGAGGDRDILLQATNKEGYRMGKFLAAYSYEDLVLGGKPLWTTDDYLGCAHNSARLADINGDGRDEVLGATIISAEGEIVSRVLPFKGHIDSVFVADIKPEIEGLELVLLEEGPYSNYVQLLGINGPIWRKHFRHWEPQNAAIGRFKRDSREHFIWCRSRFNQHQKPFVFDSAGEVVTDYHLDKTAPEDWTLSGVEVIHTIDWTGGTRQLACAKERHTKGDVCVFEPLSGRFVERFNEEADRLYVADVSGDWREEIIVLNSSEIHIYENKALNLRPGEKRKWLGRNYRRLKQCHNYYSP